MSAVTLESPLDKDKREEDDGYRSFLHDDPELFVGQTDAERATRAEQALDAIELCVDTESRSGEHRLEVLRYAEEAIAHEVKRRRGEHLGEPPRPPSDLAA